MKRILSQSNQKRDRVKKDVYQMNKIYKNNFKNGKYSIRYFTNAINLT